MSVAFILQKIKQKNAKVNKCELEIIKYLVRRNYLSSCLLPPSTKECEILNLLWTFKSPISIKPLQSSLLKRKHQRKLMQCLLFHHQSDARLKRKR